MKTKLSMLIALCLMATASKAADTLQIEKVSAEKTTKYATTSLAADFPVAGPQPLLDSVRNYYLNEMINDWAVQDADEKDTQINISFTGKKKSGAKRIVELINNKACKDLSEGVKEIYEYNMIPWESDYSMWKVCETKHFVTFTTLVSFYQGGAHGLTTSSSMTFAKPSGKRITNIVDTTKIEKLRPLIEEGLLNYFTEEGEGVKTSLRDFLDKSLIDEGIDLPIMQLALTEEGVEFTYQSYEIGPYSIGIPQFTIPYKKIRPFLTREARAVLSGKSF